MSSGIKKLFQRTALKLAFLMAVAGGVVSCKHDVKPAPVPPAVSNAIFEFFFGPLPVSTDTVAVWDSVAMKKEVPAMYDAASDLGTLPITGADVYRIITDSTNHLKACMISRLPDDEAGVYTNHDNLPLVRTINDIHSLTAAHEYFHAAQDVNDGTPPRLTDRDELFNGMLTEACAIGYEMVVHQEAANHGLNMMGTPLTASVDSGVVATFDSAYGNACYRMSEELALQTAGRPWCVT